MKLIITADDYGMTTGVTDGIIACARDGLLTQTGLFTNMPSTEYAVERWKSVQHLSLGQDLNLSTGSPVSDPRLIPSLVQENGAFLTSRMHREKEQEQPDSVSYDEAFLEYENQVKRFLELVGKKPAYIQGHAWHNETTNRALADVAKKYGVLRTEEYQERFFPKEKVMLSSAWCRPVLLPDKSYDYSINTQLAADPLKMFIEGTLSYLDEHKNDDIVAEIHTHAGFMDRDLYLLSSFTAVRVMEAGFICSKELREWVEENKIEMTSFEALLSGE